MAISAMYPAMPGSPKTELAADISASATSMTVTNGNALPDAPNILVVGNDESAEVIGYGTKSGNTLGNLVRPLGGTTASAWTAGTEVARNFTSFDHDRFKENIEDLATNKADAEDVYTQTEIDTLLNAKQNSLTFDSTPTASSANPVTSGGVKDALDTLDDSKVSKSGDTMMGGLTVDNGNINVFNGNIIVGHAHAQNYLGYEIEGREGSPAIHFYNTGTRLTIDQYANGSAGGERFLLPTPEARSSDAWYEILTSKSPVTTAQGGTGGTDSGWQSYTNSSAFSGTIKYRKVGVFLEVTGNMFKLAANLGMNTYVQLGTLPSGYHPSQEIIASCYMNTGVPKNRVVSVRIMTAGEIYLCSNSEEIANTYGLFFSGFGFM